VRLDDDQTRISGARRADVTGVGAWEPPCRGIGIAKILKKRNFTLAQGCHPVDVGLIDSHISKANLIGANLIGANLGGVDLSVADLRSATAVVRRSSSSSTFLAAIGQRVQWQ
jgi:uncharacterized protein YjbI with pentapeptide repeats